MNFRNVNGMYLTRALFLETDTTDSAIYTLKDRDHELNGKSYKSLRRLYMETEDPTEFIFATTYLDGWKHWKELSEALFFSKDILEWREELEVRLRAKSLLRLREKAANSSDKEAGSINKFLVQSGWKDSSSPKSNVGRPTKEKIKQEAERLFQTSTEHDEDFKRLGLN